MRLSRLRQRTCQHQLDRCCPCLFAAMLMKLEEMQLKDTLRMFNGLVERCFANCVQSFQSKTLDSKEERCVTRCTAKFIKASARAGQTFQELGAPGPGGAAGGGGAAGQ